MRAGAAGGTTSSALHRLLAAVAALIAFAGEVVAEVSVQQRPGQGALDPVQRRVIELLELRDYPQLERLLGGDQLAFEGDAETGPKLAHAFDSFARLPLGAEPALTQWVTRSPGSYAAHASRATYHYAQGMDARGEGYIHKTPSENIRAMQIHLHKAKVDFERSLELTGKPYVSRLGLMRIARHVGSRAAGEAHYLEAVRLAPQSVEIRLERMQGPEPRWGGSYAEMEAFAAEARSQLRDPRMADRVAALVPQHRADIEREAKNFAPALEHYSAAIALFSTARRLCARSYVLSQLKRDAEAFADVKLALSKSHKHRYCVTRAVGQAAKATDAAQAIQLLSMALEADPRSRAAYNERAWKHQQTGRLDLAFKDYRASAELGDWVGELQVGKFLWSGLGVTQDRETALVWLRKAAAHGDRNAKVSLQQALDVLGRKE